MEGADEGEKAHHVVGRIRELCPSKSWWRQGPETHSRLLLHTDNADADFMEASEHCQSIGIADDPLPSVNHLPAFRTLVRTHSIRNRHSGEDAGGPSSPLRLILPSNWLLPLSQYELLRGKHSIGKLSLSHSLNE